MVLHPRKPTHWEAALAIPCPQNRGGCAACMYPEAMAACSIVNSALLAPQPLGSGGWVMWGWWVVGALARASQVINADLKLVQSAS